VGDWIFGHKAEKFKESKYRDTIGSHTGEIFVPFCVDTFVRLGKNADEFLKEATVHLQDGSTQSSEARARLNRALLEGNAILASPAWRVDEGNYAMMPVVERS